MTALAAIIGFVVGGVTEKTVCRIKCGKSYSNRGTIVTANAVPSDI